MKILTHKNFDPKTNKAYTKYKGQPLQVSKIPIFISDFYSQRTDIKFLVGNFFGESKGFEINETNQKTGQFLNSWGGKTFKLRATKSLRDKLNKTLKEVSVRYIFLPLTLYINKSGHANILFFDTVRKTILRYEPFGKQFNLFNDIGVDSLLIKFFKANKVTEKFKFENISIACPNWIGPQYRQKLTKSEISRGMFGYCMMFSYLFIINTIANVRLTPGKVMAKLLKLNLPDIIRRFTNFAMMYSDGKIYVTSEEEQLSQVIRLMTKTKKRKRL